MKQALLIILVVAVSNPSWSQLAEQSKLTVADKDPSFKLNLAHLAQEVRAFGLSPREITWAPDGSMEVSCDRSGSQASARRRRCSVRRIEHLSERAGAIGGHLPTSRSRE